MYLITIIVSGKGYAAVTKESMTEDISLDNIRAIAAENSGLRNQIVVYRRKVMLGRNMVRFSIQIDNYIPS